MNLRLLRLKRRKLDEKLSKRELLKDLKIPENGWIYEIRTALNMSYVQIAKRLKVTPSAIKSFEKSEQEGRISADTLRKAAEVMKCKFVYAIVPETSLEKIYDEQALKVAGSIFKKASHSMELEKQGVDEKEKTDQLKDLYDEINHTMSKKIWDYEI
ncbi:MAG: mobile mystery protein A [Ignavibacteria bacterium]|nr:mobile mystery protein A [Ignavibacteria bacterium]